MLADEKCVGTQNDRIFIFECMENHLANIPSTYQSKWMDFQVKCQRPKPRTETEWMKKARERNDKRIVVMPECMQINCSHTFKAYYYEAHARIQQKEDVFISLIFQIFTKNSIFCCTDRERERECCVYFSEGVAKSIESNAIFGAIFVSFFAFVKAA